MSATISISGNLTREPYSGVSKDGTPYLMFTVASNRSIFNKQANEWENIDTVFFDCKLLGWRADALMGTLEKGSSVVLNGEVRSGKDWTDKSGVVHSGGIEVNVREIGHLPRKERSSGGGRRPAPSTSTDTQARQTKVQTNGEDPWGAAAPFGNEEPPF